MKRNLTLAPHQEINSLNESLIATSQHQLLMSEMLKQGINGSESSTGYWEANTKGWSTQNSLVANNGWSTSTATQQKY